MAKRIKHYYKLVVFLFCIAGGYVTKGRNLYLSRKGNDTWPCNQKNPCKTIGRAVTLATHGDLIYLDGTNTDKDPYTCDSGTLVHPEIYINKSLSLIGFGNPLPRIRRSGGSCLAFNGSADALHEIRANLSGIVFSGSSLTFLETSAYIQNCKFDDSHEGVKFTIHKMIDSSLHIKDAIFSGNKAGISVDLPHTNQGVSFDLTLENVTLIHNQFSSKGLISLNMKNGNHNIHFKDVTFIDNSASGYQYEATECFVQSTRAAVTILIESSHFQGQQARLFAISGSNISLFIHNSSFVGYKVGPAYGHGGVVYLSGPDHPEQRTIFHVSVSNSTFVNTSAAQGGAIDVEAINACNISFRDSIFTGNTAWAGEGGAVFIGSSGPVFHDDKNPTNRTFGEALSVTEPDGCYITVERSTFSNNVASSNGGAVSVSANSAATIILQNVTMESNKAKNFGGAIYVSDSGNGEGETFRPTELPNLCNITVVLSVFSKNYALSHTGTTGGAISISGEKPTVLILANVTMEGNGAQYSGGAVHVDTVLSALKVYESFFYNNNALGPRDAVGGAISIKNVRNYSGTPNLTVEHSTFSNNKATHSGGAVYLRANEKSVLRLSNLTMESNTVEFYGGAIAVHVIYAIAVHDSEFLDNTALSSLGAALSVDDSTFSNCSAKQVGGAFYLRADAMVTVEVKRSRFVGNHAFKYYGGAAAIFVNGGASPLLFEDTAFEKNAAVFGGAVHLSNGNATFQNCTFLNNLVQVLGGHIHTDLQSTNLFIWDCVFNQTLFKVGNENYSAGAFFIDTQSKGSLDIQNTSLTANYPENHDVLIRKTNGREVNLDNLTTLTCPVGSQMKVLYFQIKLEDQTTVTILEVRCLACEGNTYSLNRGRAFGLQEGPEFSCLSCPYGANCTQNIVAEPNFWGFKYNPSTLKFITCPYGYCSSPHEADFPEYDSCQGNRSGILCGHCKESHTETLYSASCAPSSECKDHWIWPVGLIYVSIMALLFTFRPPIVPWIKRQILWFKRHDPANQDEEFDRGYLKIVFYFYQAANLLLVSDSTLHILKTEIWEPVIGLFNFQQNISPVSTTGVICPFPGLNAVTKRLLLASPVFGTMLMIAVFYMLHWGSKKIQCREAPPVGPYIGGILQTILLGYATMASMSFDLLTCVPIRSEKRLFYDGNIACYQPWQFLFVAFVFVFFVPFLFVLMWGSFKLYRGTVSVANFLLACCLPLPILLYWAYIALIYRAPPLVRLGEQPAGQASTKISVERVLYDPFKRPEEGSRFSLSWEGVMIAWRLILIVLNAFIDDPLSRLLVMTSFCVLFLLLHCIAQPFRDGIANTVETISLLCVVQLGIINTFFASFHSLGVPLQGSNPLISWASAFQITEIIILGFVPAVACLFVVAAVLSLGGRLLVVLYQTIRHLAKLCYSRLFRKQENEEAPLLV
ncbi:uncharacterized protein [Montipora foliosa]|uniref:uncharacterized protein n=1 Tax=Montipora foliosa TaxID=591990 RepID=UPI0035F1E06F